VPELPIIDAPQSNYVWVTYMIGNDGITLYREEPTAVNTGEIVVVSNEELHAARLSGKRLLALWNTLPISKRSGKSATGDLSDCDGP
jgi:hypothetical protein